MSPISRVSAVNSGCSPITQDGKSNRAMLNKGESWRNCSFIENGLKENSPIAKFLLVLRADVGHDVLVEEFEDERDAIRKNQVLGHELKLVDVVHLKK